MLHLLEGREQAHVALAAVDGHGIGRAAVQRLVARALVADEEAALRALVERLFGQNLRLAEGAAWEAFRAEAEATAPLAVVVGLMARALGAAGRADVPA